jgi:hypothetical protein
MIRYKKDDGSYVDKPFVMGPIEVAQPGLVVSPDNMNKLYVGIDNPLSISVPGVADKDISPIFSGGAPIQRKDGKYVLKPTKVGTGPNGTETVSVSVTLPGGNRRTLGPVPFRVASIPKPKASIQGRSNEKIPKNQLVQSQRIAATFENFDFDLRVKIVGFTAIMVVNGQVIRLESKSNLITPEMKDRFGRLRSGTSIVFTDIAVAMPTGTESIDDMTLTLE